MRKHVASILGISFGELFMPFVALLASDAEGNGMCCFALRRLPL